MSYVFVLIGKKLLIWEHNIGILIGEQFVQSLIWNAELFRHDYLAILILYNCMNRVYSSIFTLTSK